MASKKKSGLPERVFLKGSRYYLVKAEGKKRIWIGLTKAREGLPALYSALSDQLAKGMTSDMIPALIADWKRDVGPKFAAKTMETYTSRLNRIADQFADFRVTDVESPDVAEFLRDFRHQARTHNQYRGLIQELMRYSIERGMRKDNPVTDIIKTMSEKPRTRYITDSELRRIKVGAIYPSWRGGRRPETAAERRAQRNPSGRMICCLVDMAYLTGQDIGMLLQLRWTRDPDSPDVPFIGDQGLFFRRAKVLHSTGAAVTIEWTPKLLAVVDRLKAIRAERMLKKRASQRIVTEYVFTRQDGLPFTYSGASTAWKRAVKRAGVPAVMFRDIRAKAITDKEERDGMMAARNMAAHSTDSQTADYVRRKSSRRTGATR